MSNTSYGGEWLEIITAWVLVFFLIAIYLGLYLFSAGTLQDKLKQGKIELSSAITNVKRKMKTVSPTKIGAAKLDDDTLTT